jgi:hypothetical protein
MVTDNEAKHFIHELLIAFPAFDDAARSSPNLAATHRAWADAWRDLSSTDCLAALSDLKRTGEINYEDYRAPGPFIRRLVLAARRNAPKSEAELVGQEMTRREREQQRRQYQGSPMASALIEMRRLKTAGASEAEIYAAGDRIMGVHG